MFWLSFFSCTASDTEITYDTPSKNNQQKPPAYILEPTTDISDPGWIEEDVAVCENSSAEVAFSDQSSLFGYTEESFDGLSTEGGMALMKHDDVWWLWQIVAPSTIEGHSENGDVRIIDTGVVSVRLYIEDLDLDGKDDMLIVGEYFAIVWDLLEASQQIEEKIPFTVGQGVRDIGTIDADGDGDLDLWLFVSEGNLETGNSSGWLWENIGNRQYADPIQMDPDGPWAASWDGLVMDWDDDGDPDIYVCNDFGFLYGGNWVLINDGFGNFTQGEPLDADIVTACMGASVADLNADGFLDLYMTSTADQHLLERQDDGYVEVTATRGFGYIESIQMLWGADITDYDNDGLPDILVSSSDFSRLNEAPAEFPLMMYKQNQKGKFLDKGASLGFPQQSMSRVAISFDINNDGIEDIFASSASRLAHVFLSEGCTENNWIEIEAPEGSIVQVVVGTQAWTHLITAHPGMASSQPPSVHVGLGNIDSIDFISLRQPWKEPVFLIGPIESKQKIKYQFTD